MEDILRGCGAHEPVGAYPVATRGSRRPTLAAAQVGAVPFNVEGNEAADELAGHGMELHSNNLLTKWDVLGLEPMMEIDDLRVSKSWSRNPAQTVRRR